MSSAQGTLARSAEPNMNDATASHETDGVACAARDLLSDWRMSDATPGPEQVRACSRALYKSVNDLRHLWVGHEGHLTSNFERRLP